MQKRVHSREFKLEVVRQVASGEKRPAQICREYGLADSVLSRWRKEYQEKGEAAFEVASSVEIKTQEQRIEELERFCGQLALENQILKKTLKSMGSRNGVGPHHLVDAQRTPFRSRTTGFLGIDISCSGLVQGRPFFLGIGKGGGGTLYVNSSFILQI